jgi:hypothetical protein
VKSLLSLLLLSILSLPSVVLGVDFDELVERDGLFYKKFTDVPFTGKNERSGTTNLQGRETTRFLGGIS